MSHETDFELLDAFIDAPLGSETRRSAQTRLEATPFGRQLLELHAALLQGPATRTEVDVLDEVMAHIATLPAPTANGRVHGVFEAAGSAADRRVAAESEGPRSGEGLAWPARIRAFFAPTGAPPMGGWRVALTVAGVAFVVLLFVPGLTGNGGEALAGAALRGSGSATVAVVLGVAAIAVLAWFSRKRR